MKRVSLTAFLLLLLAVVPAVSYSHCADDKFNPACPGVRNTINTMNHIVNLVSSEKTKHILLVPKLQTPVGPMLPKPPDKKGSSIQEHGTTRNSPVHAMRVPLSPSEFVRIAPHIKSEMDLKMVQRGITDSIREIVNVHAVDRVAGKKAGAATSEVKQINLMKLGAVYDSLKRYNEILGDAVRLSRTGDLSITARTNDLERVRNFTQEVVDTSTKPK